jgi:hypothetical protein
VCRLGVIELHTRCKHGGDPDSVGLPGLCKFRRQGAAQLPGCLQCVQCACQCTQGHGLSMSMDHDGR